MTMCFTVFLVSISSGAQDPLLTIKTDSSQNLPDGYGEIKLTASFDQTEVPKNREVVYTAELQWSGNSGVYDILEVKNPDLENLALVKTSTVHRMEVQGNQRIAIKKHQFILQPQSLGMAYAGDVVIRYRNVVTNEESQLITNRLGIKVIDPIAEPGSRILFLPKNLFYALVFIVLASGLIFVFLSFWKKRQARIRREKEALAVQVPLEQIYLEQLKKVDLKAVDSSTQFSEISRIFRHYLVEKLGIQTPGASTSELINLLHNYITDERLLVNANEILKTCDLAKFSGGGMDNSELMRVYTLAESIFETHLKPPAQ
jgi:hypothetical protein